MRKGSRLKQVKETICFTFYGACGRETKRRCYAPKESIIVNCKFVYLFSVTDLK